MKSIKTLSIVIVIHLAFLIAFMYLIPIKKEKVNKKNYIVVEMPKQDSFKTRKLKREQKAREEKARQEAKKEAERKERARIRQEQLRKAREEKAKQAREEKAKQAREEKAKQAREKQEQERKAREEKAKQAREKQEQLRKAREEKARQEREEQRRRARIKQEQERKAREEQLRKQRAIQAKRDKENYLLYLKAFMEQEWEKHAPTYAELSYSKYDLNLRVNVDRNGKCKIEYTRTRDDKVNSSLRKLKQSVTRVKELPKSFPQAIQVPISFSWGKD